MIHLRVVRAQGVTLNGRTFSHPELAVRVGEIVCCDDLGVPEAAEVLVMFTTPTGGHVVAERPGVASVHPSHAGPFERRLKRALAALAAKTPAHLAAIRSQPPTPGALQ